MKKYKKLLYFIAGILTYFIVSTLIQLFV